MLMQAHRGGGGVARAYTQPRRQKEVSGQHYAPTALPPGKAHYQLYRRQGGPQSWSGRPQKISPPRGFDPRTVQTVASLYSDYAIPAANIYIYIYRTCNIFMFHVALSNFKVCYEKFRMPVL
jgi:hypothetical protein